MAALNTQQQAKDEIGDEVDLQQLCEFLDFSALGPADPASSTPCEVFPCLKKKEWHPTQVFLAHDVAVAGIALNPEYSYPAPQTRLQKIRARNRQREAAKLERARKESYDRDSWLALNRENNLKTEIIEAEAADAAAEAARIQAEEAAAVAEAFYRGRESGC